MTKKLFFILCLLIAMTGIAQVTVTAIPMPAGYGLQGSTSGGRPYCQEGNFIYGFTQKLESGIYTGYLFKYNVLTNETNILSGLTFPNNSSVSFTNFKVLNGKIYFIASISCCDISLYRINPQTNTINLVMSDVGRYQIIGNKVYKLINSYYDNPTSKTFAFDSTTNTSAEITIPVTYNNVTTQRSLYIQRYANFDENTIYVYGYFSNQTLSNGSFYDYRIFKIDANGVTSIYDMPDGQAITSTSIINDKFLLVNNKILIGRGVSTKLDSFDINTFTYTSDVYTSTVSNSSGFRGFVYNNNAYFLDSNNLVHITDGVTSQLAGFPYFWNNYLVGSGYTDFDKDPKLIFINNKFIGVNSSSQLWKSDATFDNTINVASSTPVYSSLVHNGKIYFMCSSCANQSVKQYDEITDTITNFNITLSFDTPTLPFGYQNALYVYATYNSVKSFYKIDFSSLLGTTDFSTAKFNLYPNPTSNELNFSEALKNIEVFTIEGRKVLQNGDSQFLDVSTLPSGVYLLKGHTKENIKVQSKFVKM